MIERQNPEPAPSRAPSVILIEFNELCPHLLDKWIGQGLLPNFAHFRDTSSRFITVADETEAPNLEPWIQWYSLHTGLAFDQHKVFRLTDGPLAGHEDIWRHLGARGLRVGNCSSMNAAPFPGMDGFFIADPWCAAHAAVPAELQVYQDFVSRQVREYSRQDGVSAAGEAIRFLNFMLGHGLRPQTLAKFAGRLIAEKTWDRGSGWKRAALQDLLQFDVFNHLYRKQRPHFSTYFSNSTAHYQHAYWRHMDPEPFTVRPSEADRERYGDAILYGYRRMDDLLGRFFELEREGAMLVFATALSQQPFLRYESVGGQRFYRPRKIEELLLLLGVQALSVEPTMTHQFNLRCAPAQGDEVERALKSLRYEGEPVFGVQREAEGQFYFGCQLRQAVPDDAQLTFGSRNAPRRFDEIFYLIDGLKSGRHHPDGVLWFKTGQPREHAEKVSILDVFPTLSELMGGASGWTVTPTGLRRRGRSLVPFLAGAEAVKTAKAAA